MPKLAVRTPNFLTNVLWSWGGVAVNLFTGFFLSPFLIRKLGDDNFGVWALVLAMVEYYWLLDLGFRNATVKYSAHYRALGQPEQINRVLNTGLLYSFAVAAVTFALTLWGGMHPKALFHSDNPVFGTLLLIVGVSWSIGMIFNVFSAALEGFQRFDVTSRLWIAATAFRSLVTLAVVMSGHGLREMALVLLTSQLFIYAFSFFYFRRIFPELRLSPKLANKTTLKEMAAFASHNFAISISTRVVTQSPALLIGMRLPPRFVAYFTVPQKLLDYPADAIGRFSMVSGSMSAELCARGEWDKIGRLSIWANRYCTALYFFLIAYLGIYGRAFLTVWIKPEFAAQSAAVLPFLMIGFAATNSQYNSSSILVNSGGQKWYSRLLMVEAALFLLTVPIALSRYGLREGAMAIAALAVLSRGFGVSFLLVRMIKMPYFTFMWQIYSRPVTICAAVSAMLFALQKTLLPGTTWFQLGLASVLAAAVYGTLAYLFVLTPPHREMARERLRAILSRFSRKAQPVNS